MSNQVTATLKYALLSDRKLNLIADLVRGKRVTAALDMLEFMPKKCFINLLNQQPLML